FEDMYLQTYYPLSTIEHFPYNNEIIVARDFLFIPTTSIASEQAFSCAGYIIDNSCTLLDPDTVTALICQRNWLEVSEKF
ncbi:38787_t:CDS:2, partial [Gigaspora margarita]